VTKLFTSASKQDRNWESSRHASIGSTNALSSEFLVDDNGSTTHDSTNSDTSDEEDEKVLDDLYESVTNGNIDLNEIMLSAAHASKSRGVDAAHLSKIWQINLKTAEQTIYITSQNSKGTHDPTLSQNYGTNDRMLCHEQSWQIIQKQHLLPTIRQGQGGICICCSHEVQD
jgi:hypothetical protein